MIISKTIIINEPTTSILAQGIFFLRKYKKINFDAEDLNNLLKLKYKENYAKTFGY